MTRNTIYKLYNQKTSENLMKRILSNRNCLRQLLEGLILISHSKNLVLYYCTLEITRESNYVLVTVLKPLGVVGEVKCISH